MGGMNPYASYGSTGGTTVPGTGAAPSGMSGGMMAGLGAGAFLTGAALNYIGQSRGAKAMQEEAERQALIQRQISEAKHLKLIESLAEYDPNAQGVLAGNQAQQGMNAATPAVAAGGAALGLQGGQTAGVGAGLLTGQRLRGQQAAAGIQNQRTGQNLDRLGTAQRGLDDSARFAGQLGEASIENAGNAGADLRLAGSTIGAVGMPMMVMGMNQKAGADPDIRPDGQSSSELARYEAWENAKLAVPANDPLRQPLTPRPFHSAELRGPGLGDLGTPDPAAVARYDAWDKQRRLGNAVGLMGRKVPAPQMQNASLHGFFGNR